MPSPAFAPLPALAALLALAAGVRGQQAAAPLEHGARICLVGNALAERMQHHGWLESMLQASLPGRELVLRNLGFSADELTVQQRTAGFGTQDDYLARCEASVIFAFFGYCESFAGPDGLTSFRRDLADYVEHVTTQSQGDRGAPRLILFSSIPFEDLGDPNLPDPAEENARISLYNDAMAEVARDKGVRFVDLFGPMQRAYAAAAEPLTLNGIHLRERGNEVLARVIVGALAPDADAPPLAAGRREELRRRVQVKNLIWFNRYRATDGYNVYGGRSSLEYDGVTNFDVLQREMSVLDAMAANLDREIWALASGGRDSGFAGVEVPPLIEVATNKPGDGPDGAYRFLSGEQAIEAMTPAPGMRIELYADEELFPELVNPVQMAWDARGRLWVAAWPTYPHWEPGEPLNDKLIILEDTDGDGRADASKVFVDSLHNPTGFEFWNGGVVVANPPDLLFLRDTDGDDVADTRERILHGLSSADTHHAANSFVLGPDGALYFQEGTFHQSQIETVRGPLRNHDACVWRFEPRSWRVERYVPYGFANPHGHVFDRWGQDFVTDGTGNQNYYALPFSGHVEHPAKHRSYFTFFDQRSRPSAATEILSSRHFPEENQGNYLIANVIGFQGIFQYALEEDGSGFAAREVEPLVKSSDPSFRPVDIETGPDGALYFLDWHNPLIGHMQHHLRDPSRDRSHGRVYRVTAVDRPLLEPPEVAGRPLPELVALLKSPEDRLRGRVRIELSARPSEAVVEAARSFVAGLDPNDPELEHHLLEALWLEAQHQVLDEPLLERLSSSSEPRARAAATRVLRNMRHQATAPLEQLAVLVTDEHPRVRLEALVALSFFPDVAAAEAALLVLERPMDRFLDYALAATLATLEPEWIAALVSGAPFAAGNPAGLAHVLTLVDTDALLGIRPSEALHLELLARHGLEGSDYARAVTELAAARGSSPARELLEAIDRADQRADGHADHLLSGLFAAAEALPPRSRVSIVSQLRRLAIEGRRTTTRRLATAARIEAEGSIDSAWQEAARSVGGLGDLLDAATLLDDAALEEELYPRALGLLEGSPLALGGATEEGGTHGRYVRVELPGDERTLTLAEVEVLFQGENVGSGGVASQSSVNWGGFAARAIDGVTSGAWGDGGQTHTVEDQPNPWWELDLGTPREIDTIVLWNRTDDGGRLANRLDGFVVRVLDDERRTVFRARGGRAPERSVALDLSDPVLRVRRAAILALASLRAREGEAVQVLVPIFDDARLRAAVVEALRSVPLERWPQGSVASLAQRVEALLTERLGDAFDSEAERELLALADELAASLAGSGEGELAVRLLMARRELGPQVIVIRPIPDSLLYDRREFTVVAGRPVELVFDNVDIMPHNLLVSMPGSLARVGQAAEAMAAEPDAWERSFVPDSSEVLFATRLLQPGETQTLRFDAPDDPDDFPYVCTFPGHWVRMNGVMHVVRELADIAPDSLAAGPGEPVVAARPFVKSWSFEDLQPHLEGVAEGSPAKGRAVFEAASCLRCHVAGAEGGETGPPLSEVVARYGREELLTNILEPSRTIAEGYETELFFTFEGRVFAGKVVEEDDELILVQDDPYRADQPIELLQEEIEERRPADLSTMPEGLLSTFSRDEILDLLAYLGTLAATQED